MRVSGFMRGIVWVAVIRVEPGFRREMGSVRTAGGLLRFPFTGPLPGFPLQRGWPWVLTGFEPGQITICSFLADLQNRSGMPFEAADVEDTSILHVLCQNGLGLENRIQSIDCLLVENLKRFAAASA